VRSDNLGTYVSQFLFSLLSRIADDLVIDNEPWVAYTSKSEVCGIVVTAGS